MQLIFHKFHGAGNDFIVVDNRDNSYKLSSSQIEHICHRHFGIGADGLMLLEDSIAHDFAMKYYNSDGYEGSMCGNGGRCIVAFAHQLGIGNERYIFEAADGIHTAQVLNYNDHAWHISLQMSDVQDVEHKDGIFFIDTGSPHHIEFVSDVEEVDVVTQGKDIRYSQKYKPQNGTNVNFVSMDKDRIFIRTYERGVEAETLACGTGATAVAMALAVRNDDLEGDYILKARGGVLQIKFTRRGHHFSQVELIGPAAFVYSGEITL